MRQQSLISITVFVALFQIGANQTEGSVDTWVDACEVTDSDLLELLADEAILVNRAALTANGDGTFSLAGQAYTSTGACMFPSTPSCSPNDIWDVCPESPFYSQQQVQRLVGLPSRSAVQVGRDLVLTAYHKRFPNQDIDVLAAIFGLQYRLQGGNCVPPDFSHIPAANVFFLTAVWKDGYTLTPPQDFLVLQLDRDIDSIYPRVRRSGQGRGETASYAGDRMTLISHPERLAAKTDLDGHLYGYTSTAATATPRVTNLHTIPYSSGGLVYNRDEQFLETVVRYAIGTNGAAGYLLVQDCLIVTHSDAVSNPHDYSLAGFAQFIPAFELLVTPLDKVVHDCSTGSCTNPLFSRTIGAPDTTPNDGIDYLIHPPQGTAPALLAAFGGPLQGTLTPGQSFTVQETISVTGTECGTHERTYSVEDLTNGFVDTVRHIFNFAPCSP